MERIEPGTLLGRVRLQAVIGEGSTATVYRGHHVMLGVPAAVKVLSPRSEQRVQDKNRFLREARIAARLNDPAIVHVYDFGEYGDSCYLVMEHIEGVTLEQYLQRHETTPELTIVKLMRRVARALRVAHDAGLVHRDLKPANILIDHRGQLKVADFGLAQQSGDPSVDPQGHFNGTPAYMAPECCTVGARVDERADLYALGVIAYELVYGQLPYDGQVEEILHGHRAGNARFDLPTHCSPPLQHIVRRLLARQPESRVQSADQLLATLGEIKRSLTGESNSGQVSGDSRAPGAGSSQEFASLLRFFEDRFVGRTSDHSEGRVVHSTTRERGLVWLLLAATVGIAVFGYLARGG